jgi:hypothetical protein
LKTATGKVLGVESAAQLTGVKHDLSAGYALVADKLQIEASSILPLDASALPAEQSILSTSVSGLAGRKCSMEWSRETGVARSKMVK